MKLMNLLVAALMLLGTSLAFADSEFLDSAHLDSCTSTRGGKIELRKARNGDLAIKLVGLDKNRCDSLRFYDYSSGRTIRSYDIKGTSYTLSKSQRRALSSDCKLGIELDGYRGNEKYSIVLWWCNPSNGGGQQSSADRGISYQLSNAGNCKLMRNRQYQNRNVTSDFCQGARGKDYVSYDYSRAGNCKLMINGQYANKNVSARYCRAN